MKSHRCRKPSLLPYLNGTILIIALLGLILSSPPADAQQFHAPLVPSYGLDSTRLMIAGYPTKWDDENRTLANLWKFTRSLGIDVAFVGAGGSYTQYDDMYNSAHRGPDDRMVILSSKNTAYMQAGLGREIEFFSFDTIPSPYYYCRFYDRSGGKFVRNPSADPDYSNKAEMLYSLGTTTPGQQILGSPIYGYDSLKHIYAAPRHAWDDSARNMSDFLQYNVIHDDLKGFARTFYFVANARLQNTLGGAPDDAAVLRLEVWHDVPKGFHYLNSSGSNVAAAADTAILCDTFLISKGELKAGAPDIPTERYRIISRPSDLRIRRIDGGPGPMHPAQPLPGDARGSQRLDIRVFWTGAENVVLRSVAIRDSIGEMVLGSGPASRLYQKRLFDHWKRIILGPSRHPDSLRRAIIRVETGIESDFTPTEYASFERINQMLRDTFNLARHRQALGQQIRPGDSLSAWQLNFAGANFHRMATPPEVTYEMGFNANFDTVAGFREYGDPRLEPRLNFEVPHNQIPSIRQHNGGRGYLPQLMDLDSLGIPEHDNSLPARIEAYTTTLQRMIAGFNQPDSGHNYDWPYHALPGTTGGLARAAVVQRRTGRRFVSQIGTVNRFSLRAMPLGTGVVLDTFIGHIPEPGELRMITNLSLAYGARGILWWGLGTYNGIMSPKVFGTDTLWTNEFDDQTCCNGSNGYYQYDTATNVTDFELNRLGDDPGGRVVAVIPNFYIGYGDRTGAVREINTRWLTLVGPELMKLRWRDGYSIHHAVRWPGLLHDTIFRPIPPDELFASVASRHPFSPVPDSAHRTFVEIGVFDRTTGHDTIMVDGKEEIRVNPLKDTNHVYVVNRRTFEPPADDVLNLLDTLAETRTITIGWHLRHPDSSSYNFIRVRELAGDTTHLPFTTLARRPLDTVVYADSATLLTLGPGRGALLQITYCPPGSTLGPGDLRFSAQRKIVSIRDRYHAVYWRKAREGVNEKDTVFYRRSARVNATSGAILWEPMEYAVSPGRTGASPRGGDCFPSLTCRQAGEDSTIVTVVWSNAAAADPVPRRFVKLRQIVSVGDNPPLLRPIEEVDTLLGRDPEQWGTPVASSFDGGTMVAWSDSSVGIVARLRRLGTGSYSRPDSVSLALTGQYGAGQYPSMPPFAHIAGRDSNAAITWQQAMPDGTSGIQYARLVHAVSSGLDTIRVLNRMRIDHPDGGRHLHPSIDMTQNVWFGAQEGVTWESQYRRESPTWGPLVESWVNFSSLFTETVRRWNPQWDGGRGGHWHPYWDSIENTQQWTYNSVLMYRFPGTTFRTFHPSTASINARSDTNHALEPVTFALTTAAAGNFSMQQAIVQYATSFIWPAPLSYAWGGYHPSSSASPGRQVDRHAALYELAGGSPAVLNTSRQFFAKGARPAGYAAQGRQAHLRIGPAGRASMTLRLHDIWVAGAGGSGPVRLSARTDTLGGADSLGELQRMFTSLPFSAHDSTTIGLELAAGYSGDTSAGGGMRMDCIAELIDVADGRVVHRFDSMTVQPGTGPYVKLLSDDLDLVSGSYVVRLRLEPRGLQVADAPGVPRYPVEELTSFEEEEDGFGKLRRSEGTASGARLSAWPNPAGNPAGASTEIRFSVPGSGYATVKLYDLSGREVLRPVAGAMVDAGRYAVMTELRGLAAGTYLLELRHGEGREQRCVVEKLIISR